MHLIRCSSRGYRVDNRDRRVGEVVTTALAPLRAKRSRVLRPHWFGTPSPATTTSFSATSGSLRSATSGTPRTRAATVAPISEYMGGHETMIALGTLRRDVQ